MCQHLIKGKDKQAELMPNYTGANFLCSKSNNMSNINKRRYRRYFFIICQTGEDIISFYCMIKFCRKHIFRLIGLTDSLYKVYKQSSWLQSPKSQIELKWHVERGRKAKVMALVLLPNRSILAGKSLSFSERQCPL